MGKKAKVFRRRFKKSGNAILNKAGHHSVASISYSAASSFKMEFDAETGKKNIESDWDIDAKIVISDCFKAVSLDFDIYEERDKSNVLKKITTLKNQVIKFEKALKAAIEHRDKYIKMFGKRKENVRHIGLTQAIKLIEDETKGKGKAKKRTSLRKASTKSRR